MAQERLTMRKIAEVLRLKWECGLSNRAIARSCSISHSTVAEWLARMPDPTIGDAILDRPVHNAYRLTLKGESRRKGDSPLPMPTT